MKTHQTSLLLLNLAVALAGTIAAHAAPVSTSFTYQGQLKSNGVPVNTPKDFRFTLYSASTGANPIGNPSVNEFLCHPVVNGLFTLGLNFGDVTAYNGQARWLEIAVRPCGDAVYQVMPQRVELLPTPYAIQSLSARQVEPNGVDASALKNGAVTGEKILDGSIGATKVNSSTFGATFWKVDGNVGTTAGANFLGTADNQPLEFKVDAVRALRLEPHGAEASSTVGGYFQNSLGGAGGAVIAGGGTSGSINETFGNYAFVGAGHGSKAGGFSAVVGGAYNVSPSLYSFIGSGLGNTNLGGAAVIAGGVYNLVSALGENAFIGGGRDNSVQGGAETATVAGGAQNRALGPGGTIGGGANNAVSSFNSTISGGANNTADANASSISGGSENHASGDHSTIGGGQGNTIQDIAGHSFIGGGRNNRVTGSLDLSVGGAGWATVGGGSQNTCTGEVATVSGGFLNRSGRLAAVGGGYANSASGLAATVPGGNSNVASGDSSLAAGSYSEASGFIATALGEGNLASRRAAVAIGSFTAATKDFTMAAGRKAKANHLGSFVWADSQDFDFVSTAENQFSIRAVGGIRLETTVATINGRALLTSADLGNLWQLGGNNIAPGQFLGTLNAEPLEFKVNGQRALRLEPTLDSPNLIGGHFQNDASGVVGAVIAGGGRSGFINQIQGGYGFIGGGVANSIQPNANYSTISGGSANTNEAILGTIGGGDRNRAADYIATVSGGGDNKAIGLGTTVAGGGGNTSSGQYATVGGGFWNTASSQHGTVGGGFQNASSGVGSTVPGGALNSAVGDRSFAAGFRAKANHHGSFVWADSQGADFASAAANEFSIRAAGGVRLSDNTPNLSFGSTTRQMLNLWNTRYGIGVQPSTLYFRADNFTPADGFAWFKGGSHAESVKDPGVGGQRLMELDDGGLFVKNGVYTTNAMRWSQGGRLVDNQGGSVELGPILGVNQTPFIDFHFGSNRGEDYNVRMINDANRQLAIYRITDDINSGVEMARFSMSGLTVNGAMVNTSDRTVKAGFEPVDPKEVLEKVAALPITRWHYTNDTAISHLGPMAQDFHAAFSVGPDDKHIATVDADGVALAAIQGLNQKLTEELKRRDAENVELKTRLENLERLLSRGNGVEK